jgi:hypothetical protein
MSCIDRCPTFDSADAEAVDRTGIGGIVVGSRREIKEPALRDPEPLPVIPSPHGTATTDDTTAP